jgi:hypothetical protein
VHAGATTVDRRDEERSAGRWSSRCGVDKRNAATMPALAPRAAPQRAPLRAPSEGAMLE